MNKAEKKRREKQRSRIIFLFSFIGSIIFTIMVFSFDREAIGPEGTIVGFSHMNAAVHEFFGVNMVWDKITDVCSVLAILVAAFFCLVGLAQFIQRKKLKEVDLRILPLIILYLVVAILYIIFEILEVNYRPIIMPDELTLEASFPSSHTLLVCSVMGSAVVACRKLWRKQTTFLLAVTIGGYAVMICTVVGRLVAGVHWFTDIIAGVLYSIVLVSFYSLVVQD